MKYTIPKTPDEFMDYLDKEKESAAKLRDDINKHVGNERTTEFRNKRSFLQNIVITSATLLGFVSAFSVVNDKLLILNIYFAIGIGLHLFLICFITLYLREAIDKNIEELLKLQDRYDKMIKYQIDLAQQYLSAFIKDQQNIFDKFKKYQEELLNSDMAKQLKTETEVLDKERENRNNGKSELEYSGEIAVFCFVCGTIMIFLAILNIKLPIFYFLSLLVILFYFTFTDNLYKWSKHLYKIVTIMTRKNLSITKKKNNINKF